MKQTFNIKKEAELTTFAEVKRKNGDKEYFKVTGAPVRQPNGSLKVEGTHIPISEKEYKERNNG